MTQEAMNNGTVLYELGIDRAQVEESQRILNLVPELTDILTSPVLSPDKKHAVIDKIFSKAGSPEKLIHFIKVMCDHDEIGKINDIYQHYYKKWDEARHIKRVCCTFAGEPEKEQMEQIREFLQKKYEGSQFVFEIRIDPEILGGTVITAGYEEYDWSLEGRIRQLTRVLVER